jgi:hypothetical protein
MNAEAPFLLDRVGLAASFTLGSNEPYFRGP